MIYNITLWCCTVFICSKSFHLRAYIKIWSREKSLSALTVTPFLINMSPEINLFRITSGTATELLQLSLRGYGN
ncbi:hypothetical protein, partial [Prevotella nigrescens]|uniref:hypothetical protein n=1 Tax=Prevotella nigrescens TaxID=28133 RepID=UPI00241D5841